MKNAPELRNFLKMSPDAPQYSEKNQHYSMSGVNPTYYLDNPGVQEEQIAPLIASNTWFQMSLIAGGNITDITEDTESTYSGYVVDQTATVDGFNVIGNSFTTFGQPPGSVTPSHDNKLKCFAGYLLACITDTASNIYKMQLPGNFVSPAWSLVSIVSGTAEETFLETFLEYCMTSYNVSQIKKIDASFTLLTGIDLGAGWSINGMKNYNDTYLAIAGSNGNFNNNYLFLWNGRDDKPNYSIKMAGRFMDMKVVNGILYVAVWVSGSGNLTNLGKTTLFYLSGTKLIPLITPQISTMNQINGEKGVLFDFNNRVGVNLTSTDLLIYNKSEVGEEEFIVSTGLNFTKLSPTYDGFLVGSVGTGLYFYNTQSLTFNPINYFSQWIPVKNLSGIDILYDSPPQSGSDQINVTIYGRGEDIQTGSSVTALDSITNQVFLNQKRTRLDVKGFTGDRLLINLTTINTGAWRPIIRGIIIT